MKSKVPETWRKGFIFYIYIYMLHWMVTAWGGKWQWIIVCITCFFVPEKFACEMDLYITVKAIRCFYVKCICTKLLGCFWQPFSSVLYSFFSREIWSTCWFILLLNSLPVGFFYICFVLFAFPFFLGRAGVHVDSYFYWIVCLLVSFMYFVIFVLHFSQSAIFAYSLLLLFLIHIWRCRRRR